RGERRAHARLGGLAQIVHEVARVERDLHLPADPVVDEFRVEWDRQRRRPVPSPAERRADAVEAWAQGAEWLKLVADVDVEEGDLQRIVLQAAEVLMQLEGLPFPAVRALARAAREALLRAPVV
ncbi:MAG: hypothetical protein K6W08_14345, partial [Firmicutes bacterium]|nr:hypothetical protein [Bacillota bacterium]